MANFWLKIKIWTKLLVAFVVALYLILFVYNNFGKEAKLWLFPSTKGQGEVTTSVLQLVLGAFVLGALLVILWRTIVRTVAQIRELQARTAAERQERHLDDLKSKASRLRPRPVSEEVDASVNEANAG